MSELQTAAICIIAVAVIVGAWLAVFYLKDQKRRAEAFCRKLERNPPRPKKDAPLPEQQSTLSPVTAFNNTAAENCARAADPRFDRAMNAFWRTFHCEGQDLQRCVAAALRAADGEPEPEVKLVKVAEWYT